MGIENEPPNVYLLQERFQAGGVGAFRQPKSGWLGPEKVDIYFSSNQNLGARGWRRFLLQNRKQTVSRGAGDDLDRTRFP